jgi:hypothetical protein
MRLGSAQRAGLSTRAPRPHREKVRQVYNPKRPEQPSPVALSTDLDTSTPACLAMTAFAHNVGLCSPVNATPLAMIPQHGGLFNSW